MKIEFCVVRMFVEKHAHARVGSGPRITIVITHTRVSRECTKTVVFFFIVSFVSVLPISLERRTTNKTEWNLHYSVARHFQLFFMYIYLPCLFKRLRADLQRCSPRSRLPLQFLRHSLPQDDSVAGSCNERKNRDNKSYKG